jgi:membrane-bound ClpP family serine protease
VFRLLLALALLVLLLFLLLVEAVVPGEGLLGLELVLLGVLQLPRRRFRIALGLPSRGTRRLT